MIGGMEKMGQMERKNKRGGSKKVDQYIDGYGDTVTIGCPRKIAYYTLIFAAWWDRAMCACVCVCVLVAGVCWLQP